MRIPSRPGRLGRHEPTLIVVASVLMFLIVWQAVAAARLVSPLFLPGPLDIVDAFVVLFAQGDIWNDIFVSGQEVVYGYALAVLIALPLGLSMGWYRRLNYALDPFVSFFYSTPRVALLPLLVLWLGIGIWSKIAVEFLGSFFPAVINTVAGVRNLDAGLIWTSRSFGATDAQIFRTLALPGSVPFILAGLRLGVGHALRWWSASWWRHRVIGHSKGALAIENALRSLPPGRTEDISVCTFGCVISEEVRCKSYAQYLGSIDALGTLNSLGHAPEYQPFVHHGTNTLIPLSMQVGKSIA